MDDLFLVIGKLYYDLLRSQGIIDSLQKKIKDCENFKNESFSQEKPDSQWQIQEP
jgi:hypothetical protein